MTKTNQHIPDGWSVKKLGEIANLERGKFSIRPRNDPSCYGGDIPFVQTGDITKSEIYLKNYSQTLNEKGLSVSKLFPKNVILITIAANIGETAITTFPVACPDSLIAIQGKKSNLIWLNYILQTYKNELNSLATQNAQKNINLETLKPLKILTPSLPEQEKIAEILGAWDTGIEKLTELIALKEQQKKSLMQKLLTGKHRLPTFTQPWKDVKLGDVCEIDSSSSKTQYIEENGIYFIIDMGSISSNGLLIAKKRTNHNKDFLSKNDLVMPKDDIGGGNIIGKTIVIKQNDKFILGDHVFRLRTILSPDFISYLINSFSVNKHLRRMSTGSAQLGLARKDVEKTYLYIPSDVNEQKAIAEVLDAADEEIRLLNVKLSALKEQKKGLMQRLLTGKTRVKLN